MTTNSPQITEGEKEARWQYYFSLLKKNCSILFEEKTNNLKKEYCEEIPCPMCDKNDYKSLWIKSGFKYVRCKSCNLIYMNPMLNDSAIEIIYNAPTLRDYFFHNILLDFLEEVQKIAFNHRMDIIESLMRIKKEKQNNDPPKISKGKILDIGCAAGNFLMIANNYGWEAEGLEINKAYVEYGKNERNLKIYEHPIEEISRNMPPYDVVTIWDVVEHSRDPGKMLNQALNCLKPGGILGFSTINHSSINAKILGRYWRYFLVPDHLVSFTIPTLKKFLSSSGVEILHIEHCFMLGVLLDGILERLGYDLYAIKKGEKKLNLLPKILSLLANRFFYRLSPIMNFLKQGDIIEIYARKIG